MWKLNEIIQKYLICTSRRQARYPQYVSRTQDIKNGTSTISNQGFKSNTAKDSNVAQNTQTRRAYLNHARNGEDYYQDFKAIRSGGYYILEIVRPDTKESRDLYSLDGTRNVNGAPRIVSRQKMYVERVVSDGTALKLYCMGTDNFGRRADGCYVFYQTPDPTNHRDTYVLSITKC